MAERAVKVKEGQSGENVALREAYETDELGASRVVELVDFASRQVELQDVRGWMDSAVSSADGLDLDSLPGELVANLIDTGDKSTLVVRPEHAVTDGEVDITPIIYNYSKPYVSIPITSTAQDMGALDPENGDPIEWYQAGDMSKRCGSISAPTPFDEMACAFLFDPIAVPQGATILDARMYFNLYPGSGGLAFNVYFSDEDDATVPSSPDDLFLTDTSLTFTTPVAVDGTGWATGAWVSTGSLVAPIQSIVNRTGWATGQAMLAIFEPQTYDGSGYMSISDYTRGAAYAASLRITYAAQTPVADQVCVLETKTSMMDSSALFETGGNYISPTLMWDVYGAHQVGLHITRIGGTSNEVILKAGVI